MMSERKVTVWRGLLSLAAIGYAVSLFLNWWTVSRVYSSQTVWSSTIDGLGTRYPASSRLGELCALIVVAIIAVGWPALRSRDMRLMLALQQLTIALVIFTLFEMLDLWRASPEIVFQTGATSFLDYGAANSSFLDYGAYLAIGCAVVAAVAAFMLAGNAKQTTRAAV